MTFRSYKYETSIQRIGQYSWKFYRGNITIQLNSSKSEIVKQDWKVKMSISFVALAVLILSVVCFVECDTSVQISAPSKNPGEIHTDYKKIPKKYLWLICFSDWLWNFTTIIICLIWLRVSKQMLGWAITNCILSWIAQSKRFLPTDSLLSRFSHQTHIVRNSRFCSQFARKK